MMKTMYFIQQLEDDKWKSKVVVHKDEPYVMTISDVEKAIRQLHKMHEDKPSQVWRLIKKTEEVLITLKPLREV